jgi:ADP-ribosylglycohydrolase
VEIKMGQERNLAKAIEGSAVWAALGDAVGWISELTDEKGLQRRTNGRPLKEPVVWKRRIGGRMGTTVELPAGCYSDDTQLRLAVCRSTSPKGYFDVETFAKIELPVWQCYSLGAGRGTLAAAANLAKQSVSWFSNFFGKGYYFRAGGNGAAMRIQPHVWKSRDGDPQKILLDVFRDAIVTHGHPQGFCGAMFHALCVNHALRNGTVPTVRHWYIFLREISDFPDTLHGEEELQLFWLGEWEKGFDGKFPAALITEIEKADQLIQNIERILNSGERSTQAYHEILGVLGGFKDSLRGAGFNTSLSAAALAILMTGKSNEEALLVAANAIGSDTDTIATMLGAIIGAVNPCEPSWHLQDSEYIISEADRMSAIAHGSNGTGFTYPDLMNWKAPVNQSVGVGIVNGHLALSGLGVLEPRGKCWTSGDAEWQWAKLPYGQTILAKRKKDTKPLNPLLLPKKIIQYAQDQRPQTNNSRKFSTERETQKNHQEEQFDISFEEPQKKQTQSQKPQTMDLDTLASEVIKRGLTPELIGRAFLRCLNDHKSTSQAVALSAILARAYLEQEKNKT